MHIKLPFCLLAGGLMALFIKVNIKVGKKLFKNVLLHDDVNDVEADDDDDDDDDDEEDNDDDEVALLH